MCTIKILCHSEKGYIVQCRKCARFQIAFGTVEFTLTQEQLNDFSETINDYYNVYNHWAFLEEKLVRIPTALPSLVLALCVNELEMIHTMISQAYREIEMEKVFAFNEN